MEMCPEADEGGPPSFLISSIAKVEVNAQVLEALPTCFLEIAIIQDTFQILSS